ncbi:hypothetical protein CCAX7_54140 [Capsulimonas corticalis]|uniref:Uncharacterized protein n=1 Tax=Capsulimonas corticalis TaxID=2219043 RepID=A0A402CNE4_9BACT|nr:hypothetical protein [Capsulimonas corticalis]BDI33363.1 hypothetical protein CCAX7_54140 [Capsulimonas corticalis]
MAKNKRDNAYSLSVYLTEKEHEALSNYCNEEGSTYAAAVRTGLKLLTDPSIKAAVRRALLESEGLRDGTD